jgi:restriction system protein
VITEKTPADWHELQRDVAQVLDECGFTVEVERSTEMVRGSAEIDVYAEEVHRGRRNIILCECKHWNSRVPQTIVHAFRTVVVDTGANVGYIVGSSGFQSGAYEAARMANIRLLTWQEFQEEFQDQWLEEHVIPNLGRRLDRFLRWTEPMPPSPGRPLTDPEKTAFMELWRSFQPLVSLVLPFMPYMRSHSNPPAYPQLPLSSSEFWRSQGVPADVLEARGYREFFARIAEHADAGLTALRAAAHADEG